MSLGACIDTAAMGASASLNVEPWQIDSSNSRHPYANPATRRALKDRLLSGDFKEDLLGATKMNPGIKASVMAIIGNRNGGVAETTTDVETVGLNDDVYTVNKRTLAVEYHLGGLQRLRNNNIYNFFIVVLSLLALATRLPETFWHLLCSMGLLFHKTWTIKLAKELGEEVVERALASKEGVSNNIGMVVADNKCYFSKQVYMHAVYDAAGNEQPRPNGEMLYTNNRLWWPVQVKNEIDIARG